MLEFVDEDVEVESAKLDTSLVSESKSEGEKTEDFPSEVEELPVKSPPPIVPEEIKPPVLEEKQVISEPVEVISTVSTETTKAEEKGTLEEDTFQTEEIRSGSMTSLEATNGNMQNGNQKGGSGGQLRFRKTLRSVSFAPGELATLECELDSDVPVVWLKDNKPIAVVSLGHVEIMKENNFHELKIKHAHEEDSGVYTARAIGESGSIVSTCQLHVHKGTGKNLTTPQVPEFVVWFKDTELLQGANVHFLFKVLANPKADFYFLKDDNILKENNRVKVLQLDDESFELVIQNACEEDVGMYSCVAKNSEGDAAAEANITIIGEKDIFMGLDEKQRKLFQPGNTVEFKWYKNAILNGV